MRNTEEEMDKLILVTFRDFWGYSPGVYLRIPKEDVIKLLNGAAKELKRESARVSAAHFCGFCYAKGISDKGMGLWHPPTNNEASSGFMAEYSQFHAVIVVDMESLDVEVWHAGEKTMTKLSE